MPGSGNNCIKLANFGGCITQMKGKMHQLDTYSTVAEVIVAAAMAVVVLVAVVAVVAAAVVVVVV